MHALLFAFVAHAGPIGPGILVQVVMPPPVVLDGVHTLQIGPIEGIGGGAIEHEVRQALLDTTRIGEAPKGAAIGKALVQTATEVGAGYASAAVGGGLQGKLVSGLTKGTGAAVAEKLEQEPVLLEDGLRPDVFTLVVGGADAQLVGRLDQSDEVVDYEVERVQKDADGNDLVDGDGRPIMEKVPCRRRSVSVSFTWEVRRADAVLTQKSQARTSGDDRCGSERDQLLSAESLAAPLRVGWGPSVAAEIAPAWALRRIPLNRHKDMKEEMALVRGDDLFAAACGVQGLLSFDPTDADATANLGALLEAMGHYPDAATRYEVAQALHPDSKTQRALARVQERRDEVATLTRAYGLTYGIPDTAPLGQCAPLPAGRRVSLKKDAPLYADAAGTEVREELPKGLRLFVTVEGDYAHVVTLDGRSGWIEGRLLK